MTLLLIWILILKHQLKFNIGHCQTLHNRLKLQRTYWSFKSKLQMRPKRPLQQQRWQERKKKAMTIEFSIGVKTLIIRGKLILICFQKVLYKNLRIFHHSRLHIRCQGQDITKEGIIINLWGFHHNQELWNRI